MSKEQCANQTYGLHTFFSCFPVACAFVPFIHAHMVPLVCALICIESPVSVVKSHSLFELKEANPAGKCS